MIILSTSLNSWAIALEMHFYAVNKEKIGRLISNRLTWRTSNRSGAA
jgi:hypothetical protein